MNTPADGFSSSETVKTLNQIIDNNQSDAGNEYISSTGSKKTFEVNDHRSKAFKYYPSTGQKSPTELDSILEYGSTIRLIKRMADLMVASIMTMF